MKIVFITPGSGDNFYCENCMRDRALVRALGRQKLDVTFMPLYLPVELDRPAPDIKASPIFFGGINVYLEQKMGFFRRSPRWINKLFDSRFMLNLAAKKAGMTDPAVLGDMTLSMLQGTQGRQKREFDTLLQWLSQPANRPDLICLSNALLNGIAPAIARQLNIPVVCLLQDEDGFVDSLGQWAQPVWDQLQINSQSITRYIAVSQFYARHMAQRLQLPPEQIQFAYSGVDLDDYSDIRHPSSENPPAIGFLSRICPEKGFDRLIDAFINLTRDPDLTNLRLIVSGGQIGHDAFFNRQHQKLNQHNLLPQVRFMNHFFDRADRMAFFDAVDLVCVPEQAPVAHGRYAIEAFAAGRPIVAPDWGVFPEIIQQTSAGLLYDHTHPDDLTQKLTTILTDTPLRRQCAQNALDHSRTLFNINTNAAAIAAIFKACL